MSFVALWGCKRTASAERPEWRMVWFCFMHFSSTDRSSSSIAFSCWIVASMLRGTLQCVCWLQCSYGAGWHMWGGYWTSVRFCEVLLVMSVIVQSLKIKVSLPCRGSGAGEAVLQEGPPCCQNSATQTNLTWRQHFPPQCCCFITLTLIKTRLRVLERFSCVVCSTPSLCRDLV